MFSLFPALVTAQIFLSQQGYSYKIEGMKLISPDVYVYKNFSVPLGLDAAFYSKDGGDKTIFAYTYGPLTFKLGRRNESFVADFLWNETLRKTCELTGYKTSVFMMILRVYNNKIGITINAKDVFQECKFTYADSLSQKISTFYIGDPFNRGKSFTETVAWINDKLAFLVNICFEPEDIPSFFHQNPAWSNIGHSIVERIPLMDWCSGYGKFVTINDSAITGFDDIQTDYCQRLGGRYLDKEEIIYIRPEIELKWGSKSGCKSINVWTANYCEIINLASGNTTTTCVPDNAVFICFIRVLPGSTLYISDDDDTIISAENLEFIEQGRTEHNPDNFMLRSTKEPHLKITFKNKQWHIDFADRRDSYYLNTSFLPFGNQRWQSTVAEGKYHEIELINCVNLYCNDGICCKTDKICDGIKYCQDGKDELKCGIPYFGSFGPKVNYILEVGYNFSIMEISEIKADDASVAMRLNFAFEWIEPRITFTFTHISRMNGAQLPFNPSRDLALTNCEAETDLELNGLNSLFSINPEQFSTNIYPPVGMTIWNIFTVGFRLPCRFDFRYFPFGEQNCSLCLRIKDPTTNYKLSMTSKNISMNYSEKYGDFVLKSISQTLHDNSSKIRVQVILKSLSSYHILTSFTPSILMCMIGFCTLFFNLGFFSDRIGVSATVLLTLVVLFTDVSDRIIKTSYIKLIDSWFIGCMAFSAVIVIINAGLHYLMFQEPLSLNLASLSFCKMFFKNRNTNRMDALILQESRADGSIPGIVEEVIGETNVSSSVSSKANKLIPLERKINIAARIVLLVILLASIICMLFKRW